MGKYSSIFEPLTVKQDVYKRQPYRCLYHFGGIEKSQTEAGCLWNLCGDNLW